MASFIGRSSSIMSAKNIFDFTFKRWDKDFEPISPSISKIFLPFFAKAAATFAVIIVFPVPPFAIENVITFICIHL